METLVLLKGRRVLEHRKFNDMIREDAVLNLYKHARYSVSKADHGGS